LVCIDDAASGIPASPASVSVFSHGLGPADQVMVSVLLCFVPFDFARVLFTLIYEWPEIFSGPVF